MKAKPFASTALQLIVAAAACGTGIGALAHDEPPPDSFDLRALLAQTRDATTQYHDLNAALADGYAKFPDLEGDCVAQPGQGGMGNHYLNGALVDTELDMAHPELLVYQQRANGRLELAALEYVVPAAEWDATHAQPPVLFGHNFHLLRSPNRYGLPAPLYTLHVWLWKANPHGLFTDWNPRVTCN